MHAQLIESSATGWQRFLHGHDHDVYQLPGFVELEAERLGGTAAALLVSDGGQQLLVPLILRDLPPLQVDLQARDAVSPYGYPGMLTSQAVDTAAALRMLEFGGETLAHEGICSVLLRLNPFHRIDPDHGRHAIAIVDHGPTVWIDLTLEDDAYQSSLRSSTRYELRKSAEGGLTTTIDNSADGLAAFHDLYTATMTRLDANDDYFFTPDYERQLQDVCGERLQLFVTEFEGQPVGAAMFLDSPIGVQYHLSAAARLPGPLSPTRVILDAARRHFQSAGRQRMHLGGGLGTGEDSLFKFKAGFSSERTTFQTLRFVSDGAVYQRATSAWTDAGGDLAADDGAAFFPAYRRPLPEVSARPGNS